MQFKIPKLTKKDWLGIAILFVVVVLLAIPVYYMPNPDCEVARPDYKCASAKDVMVENCNLWGKFNCDSTADSSLPQVEWYLGNLCQIHNKDHADQLDCANLKATCNSVVGHVVCPV